MEGSSAGLISVRSATRRCPPTRRIAPRAPCAQQRGLGVMTPVGWRRAAHARRLRRPRRRALHRPPFPPVAVAALDGADARNQTETLSLADEEVHRADGSAKRDPSHVSSSHHDRRRARDRRHPPPHPPLLRPDQAQVLRQRRGPRVVEVPEGAPEGARSWSGSGGVFRTKANCLQICRTARSPSSIRRAPGTTRARPTCSSASSRST